jgi:hypothetical protein
VAPSWVEYFPASQSVHTAAPPEEYFPFAQPPSA